MKIVIKISTPPGQAKKTQAKIKFFILPFKSKNTIWTNETDDTMYWEVEGSLKQCLSAQKNAMRFDYIIRNILESKLMKKFGVKNLSKEDQKTLREMLQNGTKVEVIKQATLQEMEEGNMTFWQKVKNTFKREED